MENSRKKDVSDSRINSTSIDVRRSVAQHLKSSIDQLESLNPKLENDEERGDHKIILSVDNLTEWISQYGTGGSNLLVIHGMFLDEFNVWRYSDWKPAGSIVSAAQDHQHESTTNPTVQLTPLSSPRLIVSDQVSFSDMQRFLDITGCICAPIRVFMKEDKYLRKQSSLFSTNKSLKRKSKKTEFDIETNQIDEKIEMCFF
jgi:hypothetical protein